MTELMLVGYSAGNLGKNLVWSATDLTLLFMLTDLLGLSGEFAASLMIVAVCGDLLFDLVFGVITAHGGAAGLGYRWFIAVGSPPCAVLFALLYALPWLGESRLWVIAVAIIGFRGGYALIDVPHNALIARVALDSRARGRVSGYRLLFSSLASFAVATIIVPSLSSAHGPKLRLLMAQFGLAGALVFCATLFLASAASRSAGGPDVDSGKPPLLASALFPRFDRQFAAIMGIASMLGFAMPMFARMMLYYTRYVLAHPQLASPALAALTFGQLGGVLLWTALVRRLEKTWLLGYGHLVAIAGMVLVGTVGSSQVAIVVSSAIAGVGLASVYMLPWGLLADAVDFSEFRYGERRETAAFATFLVAIKASAALSSASIGWVLGSVGYVPGAQQTSMVKAAMTLLALGTPIIGGLLSSLILCWLPISHHRHAVVIKALARRRRMNLTADFAGSSLKRNMLRAIRSR